jgi:predicted amidophosphoribosyltransferase
MARLLKVDDSNRSDHWYLVPADRCYYFYEYTASKGYAHSQVNSFISNLKKPVAQRQEGHYRYKKSAIQEAARLLRTVLERSPGLITSATIVPIPPSKPPDHPDYDDRMEQVVKLACAGLEGADARCLLSQAQPYEASHLQGEGGSRIKPAQLQALYGLNPPAPRETIVLVDDVLTTGAHFIAAKAAILAAHPNVQVAGIFLARRAIAATVDPD